MILVQVDHDYTGSRVAAPLALTSCGIELEK